MPFPSPIAQYNRSIVDLHDATKNPTSEADKMREVLGFFPSPIAELVSEYLTLFSTFVNLSDESTLKKYIAPRCAIQHPLQIAKAMYMEERRQILNPSFEMVFPLDNEIQAYVMSRIQEQPDMQVCEMAYASGEIGMLCAYAGATVTFNDIEPQEVALLKKNLQSLPQSLREKCSIVEGSCLNLLKKKPDLEKRIDIVVCWNLLHLLSLSDQIKLLETVKEMLKSDGQAIFVTNSIYSWGDILPKDCEREDEQASACFYAQNCIVKKPNPLDSSTILYSNLSNCTEEMFSLHASEHYLYSRNADTDGKWKPSSKKIQHTVVPGALLKTVQQTMKDPQVNDYLKQNYWPGRIKARLSYAHLYNVNNLSRLFRDNGFDVLSTFIVNRWGHLVLDHSKRFKQGQQVGIIATLLNEK